MILDGIGYTQNHHGNALYLAKTTTLDKLYQDYPHTLINASEEYVGLPHNQMGNSEAGHLNIGAGRIVYTGLSLINKTIQDHTFEKNKGLLSAIEYVKKYHSKLHIMGLVSHGGVHSDYNHIIHLLKLCKQHNIEPVVHIFTDGRDVDPHSFIKDINDFELNCKLNKAKIASISGRYYAMDRDQRWERTSLAYDTIIGYPKNTFSNLKDYVNESYAKQLSDEFILPALNKNYPIEEIKLSNNDAVIFANFRPDRARQMCHCIFGSNYYDYQPQHKLQNIYLVTLTKYEGIDASHIAFDSMELPNTLGEVLSKNNLKQLRIAETEKYAHVTFFLDGGKEINYPNEKKILVPSPKVATYDLKPEMSAKIVCQKLLETIGNYDVTILNFANGDMVGHTGNLQATIKAIEYLDQLIGEIYQKAIKNNVTLFITADHGNAEEMLTKDNKPITKHTTNKVGLIVTDRNIKLNENGKLSNIATTILDYIGINIPKEMDQPSLIKHKND